MSRFSALFDIFKLIFTAICVFIGMGVIVWVLSEDYPKHWAGIILIVISAYFIVKNTLALIFNKKPRLFFGGTLLFTGLVLLNPLHLHFYCYLPAFLLDYGIWHMPSVYKQIQKDSEERWRKIQEFYHWFYSLDMQIIVQVFENNIDKFTLKNVGNVLSDDFLVFNELTNNFFKKYPYLKYGQIILSQDYIKQSILFPDDPVFGIVFDDEHIIIGSNEDDKNNGYYFIKKGCGAVSFTDDSWDGERDTEQETIYHFLLQCLYEEEEDLRKEINKVIPQQ
jgi:hypothetical protein